MTKIPRTLIAGVSRTTPAHLDAFVNRSGAVDLCASVQMILDLVVIGAGDRLLATAAKGGLVTERAPFGPRVR